MSQDRQRWTVAIEEAVLGRNAEFAEAQRQRFHSAGVWTANLVSSPGSGKTALLERTLTDLQGKLRCGVIVGDLQTDNDAERLRGKGAPVVQITTGGYCHLEADMVGKAADNLDLNSLDILFIENVGNLVCPAAYDLGEDVRVALISITEGEDKPLKYPTIFEKAEVVLVTKMDLAAILETDMEALRANIRLVAPRARIFELSARSSFGLKDWYTFLTVCAE